MPLSNPGRGRSEPQREPMAAGRRAEPESFPRRAHHRMRYDIAAVQAEMRRMARCMPAVSATTTPDPD